jgi:hypothetical protein
LSLVVKIRRNVVREVDSTHLGDQAIMCRFSTGWLETRDDATRVWRHNEGLRLLVQILHDPSLPSENDETFLVNWIGDRQRSKRSSADGKAPFFSGFEHREKAARLNRLLSLLRQHQSAVRSLLNKPNFLHRQVVEQTREVRGTDRRKRSRPAQ